MNATATLALVPATTRFAIAAAVAVLLALAWISAERESHAAVLVAGTSIAGRVMHVALPKVEIVGRRAPGKTNA